jgi:hypothetical protein
MNDFLDCAQLRMVLSNSLLLPGKDRGKKNMLHENKQIYITAGVATIGLRVSYFGYKV